MIRNQVENCIILIYSCVLPQVFPYEYQRALKQLAEAEAAAQPAPEKPHVETKPEPSVRDIEDSVTDATMEKKRLEKILDKTR